MGMKYAKITSFEIWGMRNKTNKSLLRIRPHSKTSNGLTKGHREHLLRFCIKIIWRKSNFSLT